MRPKQLLFDVDGVHARFTEWACYVHGRATDETPIWTTWNHQRTWGITDADFYAPMDRAFWNTVPLWNDGHQLHALIESRVGKDRIAFLSTPVRTAGCEEGKRSWFARHFPQYDPWADLFLGGAKWKLAHGGAILIDDSDVNCERWVAAGGEAFMIPRPWNTARALCDENGFFHVGNEQQNLEAML